MKIALFCPGKRCEDPGTPINGNRELGGVLFGDRVTFSCNNGYTLSGPGTATCQADQQWSTDRPNCNREWFCIILTLCEATASRKLRKMPSYGSVFHRKKKHFCYSGRSLSLANRARTTCTRSRPDRVWSVQISSEHFDVEPPRNFNHFSKPVRKPFQQTVGLFFFQVSDICAGDTVHYSSSGHLLSKALRPTVWLGNPS